jgi:RimJ/RimL family protein N-acetyltransferase
MPPADTPSTAEPPVYNVVGRSVALGPLRRDLLPRYVRWMNDFEVTVHFGRPPAPVTAESEAKWLDAVEANPAQVIFTMYELATGRPIGTAGLYGVQHVERIAEFGIGIGEKDCWGKGYGTETARLVVDYAFRHLGMHAVYLRTAAFNERGVRAYTKAGFRMVGRQREATFRDGARHDLIWMDCLASEW